MNIWGISANSHDAAVSVWHDKELQFAAHSERYSGIKNDGHLCEGIIKDAEYFGRPDIVVWYEDPWLKSSRQVQAGQNIDPKENDIKAYLSKYNIERSEEHTSELQSH